MLEMESINDNQNGHFIEINGGELLREKDSNIQEGTSIKIKNILYEIDILFDRFYIVILECVFNDTKER